MKILFIAGHGDGDTGALGNGLQESTLTRELVNTCAFKGRSKGLDITVYPTILNCYKESRNGRIPNYYNFNYVVEFHFNAYNGQAYGTEILVHNNEKGITVEEKILNNICSLGFRSRGVKRRNNLLNMNTCKAQGVSYALIETCFIDNKSDISNYNLKKESVADSIINGIIEGFGIKAHNQPINNDNFEKGNKVIIKGDKYATGERIPSWARNTPYTIMQVNSKDKKVLIEELYSWVFMTDIEKC